MAIRGRKRQEAREICMTRNFDVYNAANVIGMIK